MTAIVWLEQMIKELHEEDGSLPITDVLELINQAKGHEDWYIKTSCVLFAGEFSYYCANPNTSMDVPSMAYDKAEYYYDQVFKPKKTKRVFKDTNSDD